MLVGYETGDDAAIYRIDDRVALVLTTDFFAPIVDDPFDYGQIAAANALSDVYAVGGTPITALNIAAFPRNLGPDVIAKILEGGQKKAEEAGILIIGGHTIDDDEPKYGLAVTGIVTPGKQIPNSNAQPGDVLILTKAWVESMVALNKGASDAMVEVGVNSATDVTGFGLLGHLWQMMKSSKVSAKLSWSEIPILPDVVELAVAGNISGGTTRNMEALKEIVQLEDGISNIDFTILADAQTSGGLLISVPEERSTVLINNLIANQSLYSSVVGKVIEGNPGAITVQK